MAPANIRDSRMAAALLHFAARYSNGMPATLDIALPDQVPATAEELRHIEATHQVCQRRLQCSVKYCWLQKHGVHCATIRYSMHLGNAGMLFTLLSATLTQEAHNLPL